MNKIDCKVIRLAPEEVFQAQRLLYQVYIEELNWSVPLNNPSHLQVVEHALQDDYDREAVWFGVYDRINNPQQIIATGRIVHRDNEGRLELERYAIADVVRQRLQTNPSMVEMNRSAIDVNYRRSNVWSCLLQAGFEYCLEHHYSVVAATASQQVQSMHAAIGFNQWGPSFTYHDSDKQQACIYWAQYSQLDPIIQRLKALRDDE